MRNAGINRTDIQQWGGVNNYGPQIPSLQPQTAFNPYTNSFGRFTPQQQVMPQMQTPFRQPANNFGGGFVPQQQFVPQMQSPFSYQPVTQQLPQYVSDTIRDLDAYKSRPVAQRVSSGPSQPIVTRSSGMRGTPNVMMRRAEGGITSLVDAE
jgi:hypothetical protein